MIDSPPNRHTFSSSRTGVDIRSVVCRRPIGSMAHFAPVLVSRQRAPIWRSPLVRSPTPFPVCWHLMVVMLAVVVVVTVVVVELVVPCRSVVAVVERVMVTWLVVLRGTCLCGWWMIGWLLVVGWWMMVVFWWWITDYDCVSSHTQHKSPHC